MYDAEDKQFFDELYQLWAKTTGASNSYWMPEEDSEYYDGGPGTYIIWSVSPEPSKDIDAVNGRKFVASVGSNEDAEFIAGLHGAIPELIRRLHDAVDEAVRKDEANDEAQGQLADALLENQALRDQIREWERDFEGGLS